MYTVAAALWSLVVTENGYFNSPKLKKNNIEWRIINVASEYQQLYKGSFPKLVSLLKQELFLRMITTCFYFM